VRWSDGADGRLPRLAQRRVILFFWPTLASSANLKLTRFRGHRTVWVQGVHDGQDEIALRT
jgi:hypothetical protein